MLRLIYKTVIFGASLGILLNFTSACKSEQAPDPVVIDLPIAYIKRSLPVDDQGDFMQEDLREPFEFRPGAQLILRDRAAANANETVITNDVFPDQSTTDVDGNVLLSNIDIRDLEVSYDGQKLLFSMRAPELENADEDEQPTWNIWEYDRETQTLRRIIASDIIAEEGQDIAPHYLPDGRIVFSTTRQRQARANLLDEGKPQYAGLDEGGNVEAPVLHVMNADGSEIRQISFNQSHDLDPTVLTNGRIAYTRWDNNGSSNGMHLYSINPDGTQLSSLYGLNSHRSGTGGATTQFVQAREMPDGRLLVIQKNFTSPQGGGDILLIDSNNFSDIDVALPTSTSEQSQGQISLSVGEVATDNSISRAGRYLSAYPLNDGSDRLLVAWSQCRLVQGTDENERIVPRTDAAVNAEGATEANPLYGLFVYDLNTQAQLPIIEPEEGILYSDVVSMEQRDIPNVILDNSMESYDQELADEGVGLLKIRSVYDFDGTDVTTVGIGVLADPAQTNASARPARFIRIVKGVPLPDDDLLDIPNTAFGASRAQLMREIVGYSTIEPDGSVSMKIPANLPFMVSVLDENGRRITARHQAWIQLRPGEVRECNGCHDPNSNNPHGRIDAQAASINQGAASDNMPFANTDPLLLPLEGETMAETAGRINGLNIPLIDILFTDIWTDEAVRPRDADLNYLYQRLSTEIPTSNNCLAQWNPSCRIVINYETHIHPLWSVDRRVFDTDGVTLIRDDTCTSCHSPADAVGVARVPASQLDLSDGPSVDEPDHYTSYRELLFNDNEQELQNGTLVERRVIRVDENGNIVYQTDGNGELILDGNGNPIPLTDPVNVAPSMSPNGSMASDRFVDRFLTGGSHAGRLSDDELKLLFEWLDIGAQYYNNPFAVPQQ